MTLNGQDAKTQSTESFPQFGKFCQKSFRAAFLIHHLFLSVFICG